MLAAASLAQPNVDPLSQDQPAKKIYLRDEGRERQVHIYLLVGLPEFASFGDSAWSQRHRSLLVQISLSQIGCSQFLRSFLSLWPFGIR